MTVSFLTLGCKVNQYESEAIAEALEQKGFSVLPFGERVDATVINTCAVTTEGERKARQMVRRAIAFSPNACIVVIGCASQLHPNSFSEIEGVHCVLGNGRKMAAVDAVLTYFGKEAPPISIEGCFSLDRYETMSIEKSERTRAYIKIEDGCDSKCAYCIIRKARGKIRSRPIDEIIREARRLTEKGYREIVLTGIEISSYGKDTKSSLLTLLEALDKVEGIGRIRLGSLDPAILKDSFIKRLALITHLCHHFHLSLQSGCSKTLAAMRRRNTAEQAEQAIAAMRKAMPDATFTADVIVGFPGESEEDFAVTEAFLARVKLLDCHIFAFSPRPGTEAAEMPHRISGKVKAEREKVLAKTVAQTKEEILAAMLGKTVEVLFEENKDGYAIGHTANYIEVALETNAPLHNSLVNVRITSSDKTRLVGVIE